MPVTDKPHTSQVIYKLTVPNGIHQFNKNCIKFPEDTGAGGGGTPSLAIQRALKFIPTLALRFHVIVPVSVLVGVTHKTTSRFWVISLCYSCYAYRSENVLVLYFISLEKVWLNLGEITGRILKETHLKIGIWLSFVMRYSSNWRPVNFHHISLPLFEWPYLCFTCSNFFLHAHR